MKSFQYTILLLILGMKFCLWGYSQSPEIRINTNGDTAGIYINKTKIDFGETNIRTVLGPPDRIDFKDERDVVFKRSSNGYKGWSADSSFLVQDTYMIYDEYGIIFATSNLNHAEGPKDLDRIVKMFIFFPIKRDITWDSVCRYEPKNKFQGNIFINGILIDAQQSFTNKKVSEKTDPFSLLGLKFEVDWFDFGQNAFRSNSEPYFRVYVNNWKEQKVSNIVVWRPEK